MSASQLTLDEAKKRFEQNGVTIAEWAMVDP